MDIFEEIQLGSMTHKYNALRLISEFIFLINKLNSSLKK